MSNKEFTGHPDARRPKNNPFAWINLAFLAIIVICCNYIGCREYGRLDLSEYESYSISERTLNVLSSEQVQKIESPIRIIFAFPGSSPGYHRMYLLLEEYKRHAKGKIEIECFDPLRQPGRAREVAHTYNVKFDQAYCIVDARTDKDMRVSHSEVSPDDAGRYRCIPGSTFLRYETQPDGKRNVVALMMDEVLCNEIIKTNPAALVPMPKIHEKEIIRLDINEVAQLLDLVESGDKLTKGEIGRASCRERV